MYNAQPKVNLDTLLGGILILGGVAWTVMTMAFMPAPEAPANLATQQSQRVATAASSRSTDEFSRFPSDDADVIVDEKFA